MENQKKEKGAVKREGEIFIFDNYTAVGIAEGFIEADSENQYLAAWQYLVNNSLTIVLQGWFGRYAKNLIDAGYIEAPKEAK